jgi:hypothetical protein
MAQVEAVYWEFAACAVNCNAHMLHEARDTCALQGHSADRRSETRTMVRPDVPRATVCDAISEKEDP